MSKKILKSLSLLVAVSLLLGTGLVGCGEKKDTAQDTTVTTTTTAKVEPTAEPVLEPVTITYSTFRAEDEAIFKTIIENFQKANPTITVNFDTNKDTGAYYTNLKAALQSGTAADVFDVHPGNDFVQFAQEGIALDLSDMEFIKNYQDGPKDLTTIDGKVFGYNQAINLECMIYNKEIFKTVGVDVPKDWADFVAIMNKLKDAKYGGIAYPGGAVSWGWLGNAVLSQTMGATAYKDIKEGIDKGDVVTVKDNAKFYSALKTLSAYSTEKLLYDNSVSVQYPQSLSLFAQKKTAVMMMGTWTFGTKDTDYPGIDVGIFPIPTLDGISTGYGEAAQISMINAASKGIAAAKTWVNYLASTDAANYYISKAKMTPTIKGVVADFPGVELLSAQMDKGVVVNPIAVVSKVDFWDSQFQEMFKNILFKGADVDKEVATFEAALKKADIKNKK